MRIGASKTWKLLAVAAARDADVNIDATELDAQAAQIARSADGCIARNQAWAEYESVLTDPKTYTIDATVAWLAETWQLAIPRTNVARDRDRALAGIKRTQLINNGVAAGLAALKNSPNVDLYEDGMDWIQQRTLDALMKWSDAALNDLSANQVIHLMENYALGGKVRTEKALMQGKLDERKRIEAATRRAVDAQPEGTMTKEDVYKIIDQVMKGAA